MDLFGPKLGANTPMPAGRHYGLTFQAAQNLSGATLEAELEREDGGAGQLGLELWQHSMDAIPKGGGYLHRGVFTMSTDRAARAIRVAVAGAANRAQARPAILDSMVSIYEVNEAEFARRNSLGGSLHDLLEAGAAPAVEAARQARDAARGATNAFGAIGETFAKIAIWTPIVAAGAVGLVVAAIYHKEIGQAFRSVLR